MFKTKIENIPDCLKEDETFLKRNYIRNQTYEFIPLNKGGCSENYILKTKKQSVFIKKPHQHAKKAIQDIIRHLTFVQNVHLCAPKVLGKSPKNALILTLVKGQTVPSNKITLLHLNQLWKEYQKIKKIPVNKIEKRLFYNLEHFYDLFHKKLKSIYLSSFFIRRYLWHIILNAFNFPRSEIVYSPQKIQTIHGDFHNNNILFDHNKLSGILDWEETTIGYACQDWLRYTFCLIERLSNYYQRRQKTKMILNFLLNKKTFSRAEWALAFDTIFIHKIIKIANDRHLSLFRLFKATLFVIFWRQQKNWVLKQVKKLS